MLFLIMTMHSVLKTIIFEISCFICAKVRNYPVLCEIGRLIYLIESKQVRIMAGNHLSIIIYISKRSLTKRFRSYHRSIIRVYDDCV